MNRETRLHAQKILVSLQNLLHDLEWVSRIPYYSPAQRSVQHGSPTPVPRSEHNNTNDGIDEARGRDQDKEDKDGEGPTMEEYLRVEDQVLEVVNRKGTDPKEVSMSISAAQEVLSRILALQDHHQQQHLDLHPDQHQQQRQGRSVPDLEAREREPGIEGFRDTVQDLTQVTTDRLYTTVEEDRLREEQLNETAARYNKASADVKALQKELEGQRASRDREVRLRESALQSLQSELENLKISNAKERRQFRERMERQETDAQQAFQAERTRIQEEMDRVKKELSEARHAHTERELSQRVERRKMETKVKEKRDEYEGDMEDLYGQERAEEEEHATERKEVERLQKVNAAYQKEAEERRQREEEEARERREREAKERRERISMARKIQEWWRGHWEEQQRRKEKKKKKKKGKKKK